MLGSIINYVYNDSDRFFRFNRIDIFNTLIVEVRLERKDKVRLSGKSQLMEDDHELSTLDLGTMEFMKWLMADKENTRDCLVVVKDFFENKYVILFDKCISKSVIVGYRDSMPWCMNCNTDDCGHVGFAICLKQHCDRNDQLIY